MAKPGKIPDFKMIYPDADKKIINLLQKTERKMQYQEYDLKAERTIIDRETHQAVILPSREVPYDYILNEECIYDESQVDVETIVLKKLQNEQLHVALDSLDEKEKYLIIQIFFRQKSERALARELDISQNAVNKQRKRILRKLKKILENF